MTMVAIRKADRQLLSPGIRGPTPSSEDRLLVLGVWVLVLGVLCLQSSWPELGVDDMFGQGTGPAMGLEPCAGEEETDRKSTRLNSSHVAISYAGFCLKKKITLKD